MHIKVLVILLIAFFVEILQFLLANCAKIVESIKARRIRVKLNVAYQRLEERIAKNRRKMEHKITL